MVAPPDKKKQKILIADPHETSRNVITIMLHKLGYCTVLEAADCEEVKKIVAQNTRSNSGMSGLLGKSAPGEVCDLDLIILDCSLKPGSGMEYLRLLRKKFPPDQAPVLFIAMKGAEYDFAEATDAGANDTLEKPFSQNVFAAKLATLLGSSKAPVVKSFAFGADAGKKKEVKKDKPDVYNEPAAKKVSGSVLEAKSKTGGGNSFYGVGAQKVQYSTDGEPTATVTNGKIDDHYQERVNVIGGGVNCYWATGIEGRDEVKLEYLTPTGKRTGMEAKKVPLEQFMYTFYLCEEYGCPIMERVSKQEAG